MSESASFAECISFSRVGRTHFFRRYLIAVGALLIGTACSNVRHPTSEPLPRASSIPTARDGRWFNHVVVIVLENADYDSALKDQNLRELATRGALFTDYHGVTHPSYHNYLALVSGDPDAWGSKRVHFDPTGFDLLNGLWKGDAQVRVRKHSIADALESAGYQWAQYAEDYPGGSGSCYLGSRHGLYARKHVPFLSFSGIQDNPNRCVAHVVPVTGAAAFAHDYVAKLKLGQAPAYAFYSPNLVNDGHDNAASHSGYEHAANNTKKLAFAGAWARALTDSLFADSTAFANTLVVLTFDESEEQRDQSRDAAANRIYTVFLGGMVQPCQVVHEWSGHYNVLRTVEENFGLRPLAAGDDSAHAVTAIWRAPSASKRWQAVQRCAAVAEEVQALK